jgi:N-acetyl-anhydromuramyl-L-alanine amidase AmpD
MNLPIVNVIKEVDDGKPGPRDILQLDTVAVHRVGKDMKFGIDLGDTAVEICAHFTGKVKQYPEVAKATGGQIAYTFMISGDHGDRGYDGMIWQCLPLSDVGHHAKRFSKRAVGIAVIGDPRVKPCSPKQYNSLIWLCSKIVSAIHQPPGQVRGHMELPNASSDPTKECPGELLPMIEVRRDVARLQTEASIQDLLDSGMAL